MDHQIPKLVPRFSLISAPVSLPCGPVKLDPPKTQKTGQVYLVTGISWTSSSDYLALLLQLNYGGGCGFLGSNMVEALLNRGETQVRIFDVVRLSSAQCYALFSCAIQSPLIFLTLGAQRMVQVLRERQQGAVLSRRYSQP